MKTLDVQALHNAIDQTLEQLKQQSDEIAKVKKAVEGITSLDDALKRRRRDPRLLRGMPHPFSTVL
ncbi:integrase YxiD [Bacillus licheniformis WX-02]|nr:T7SS effector LXG polymorphic toxin [Bacillus licheniformis]AKQ72092.1 integrase YxiD [Bacillus licheniformis WX-02]